MLRKAIVRILRICAYFQYRSLNFSMVLLNIGVDLSNSEFVAFLTQDAIPANESGYLILSML